MKTTYVLTVLDADHVDMTTPNEPTIHFTRDIVELEIATSKDTEHIDLLLRCLDLMNVRREADLGDIQWEEDSDEEEKERAEQHEEDEEQ